MRTTSLGTGLDMALALALLPLELWLYGVTMLGSSLAERQVAGLSNPETTDTQFASERDPFGEL